MNPVQLQLTAQSFSKYAFGPFTIGCLLSGQQSAPNKELKKAP